MKMFLFFSHKLTPEQTEDAKSMGVDEFVYLPKELQKSFSMVPPELENLDEYVKPFFKFLKSADNGDLVLIQGDFGVVCKLVEFCKKRGLKAIYATTKREVIVEKDGTKVSKFQHIRYRSY